MPVSFIKRLLITFVTAIVLIVAVVYASAAYQLGSKELGFAYLGVFLLIALMVVFSLRALRRETEVIRQNQAMTPGPGNSSGWKWLSIALIVMIGTIALSLIRPIVSLRSADYPVPLLIGIIVRICLLIFFTVGLIRLRRLKK